MPEPEGFVIDESGALRMPGSAGVAKGGADFGFGKSPLPPAWLHAGAHRDNRIADIGVANAFIEAPG